MLKGKLLRILLVLSLFFVSSAYACIPCDPETSVMVISQATPKFDKSYRSTETNGQVTFKVDIGHNNKIENIKILSRFPDDVPTNPVIEMVKNSGFRLSSDKKGHVACSVKEYELTFNFHVREKIDLKIEIDL